MHECGTWGGGAVFQHDAETVYVNQFVAGKGTIPFRDASVTVTQRTDYPWDGDVTLDVECQVNEPFDLAVRIPGWARNEAFPTDLYRFVEVYWFDDTGRGECRVPASWRLLHRQRDRWLAVDRPTGYGRQQDRFNVTSLAPVVTDTLRLEVQVPEGFSSGILEWIIE